MSKMIIKQFMGVIIISFILLSAGYGIANGEQTHALKAGSFSGYSPEDPIPDPWKPLTFKKIRNHTSYDFVEKDGRTVIRAVSNASASGLIRKISINPREYQWITWHWKTENIIEKGDVTRKEGDDYPARIYISFAYDPSRLNLFEKTRYKAARLIFGEYPPHGAINYIWDGKAEKGTIAPNPFTDRVQMIVVESGEENIGVWQKQTRNIYEDYKKAFGEEPPLISGVAVMTDSDNTGESAVAYYGDILFMKDYQ